MLLLKIKFFVNQIISDLDMRTTRKLDEWKRNLENLR